MKTQSILILLATLTLALATTTSAQIIYVSDTNANRVGTYSLLTGAAINASYITGLYNPFGIVIANSVPEPSTWAMLAAGAGSLLGFRRRSRGQIGRGTTGALSPAVVPGGQGSEVR